RGSGGGGGGRGGAAFRSRRGSGRARCWTPPPLPPAGRPARGRASAARSRSTGSARRRKSPPWPSICCRTTPASPRAPTSRSMAATRHGEAPVEVMVRLRDKVVLVTGASSGLGSVVADAIVRAGGLAVTGDRERRPGADHVLDVTLEADWRAVIDRIGADHGRLDGLVNAAGITVVGTVDRTALAVWRRAIDVNVLGTFLGTRAAWAML